MKEMEKKTRILKRRDNTHQIYLESKLAKVTVFPKLFSTKAN